MSFFSYIFHYLSQYWPRILFWIWSLNLQKRKLIAWNCVLRMSSFVAIPNNRKWSVLFLTNKLATSMKCLAKIKFQITQFVYQRKHYTHTKNDAAQFFPQRRRSRKKKTIKYPVICNHFQFRWLFCWMNECLTVCLFVIQKKKF